MSRATPPAPPHLLPWASARLAAVGAREGGREGTGTEGGCGRRRGTRTRALAAGAPHQSSTHIHTLTRTHERTTPALARAAGLCVRFGVGRSPTSPGISAPRTRVPAGPARPTTRTQQPLAPSGGRHGEPRASRAQPRPRCTYRANAAPAGANRGTRGAGPPRGPLKLPASARPGAWAAVKRPAWRSPPVCCRQSAHWGAAPQLAWGLWDAVLTCAPGTLSTLSRGPANGWDR